jgi:hypothetical protein
VAMLHERPPAVLEERLQGDMKLFETL